MFSKAMVKVSGENQSVMTLANQKTKLVVIVEPRGFKNIAVHFYVATR